MNIVPAELPIPAEYLHSGDHALIVAWAMVNEPYNPVRAVLCLEDGTPVMAPLDQIRFDWRYDNSHQKWVDVSGIDLIDYEPEGDADVIADQEPSSDGGEAVSRRIPEVDGAGSGDPSESWDQGARSVDPGEGDTRGSAIEQV